MYSPSGSRAPDVGGSATCPEDSSGNTDNCTGYDLKSNEEGSWATNPGTGAGGPGSDLFGFNGLGGGGRYYEGYMNDIMGNGSTSWFGWTPRSVGGSGFRGIFYSATESDATTGKVQHLGDDVNGLAGDSESKLYGFSLRCVQD